MMRFFGFFYYSLISILFYFDFLFQTFSSLRCGTSIAVSQIGHSPTTPNPPSESKIYMQQQVTSPPEDHRLQSSNSYNRTRKIYAGPPQRCQTSADLHGIRPAKLDALAISSVLLLCYRYTDGRYRCCQNTGYGTGVLWTVDWCAKGMTRTELVKPDPSTQFDYLASVAVCHVLQEVTLCCSVQTMCTLLKQSV